MMQAQLMLVLQQQLIDQVLDSGGGSSLTDALLQKRQKSGREIAAAALTGRIRSDAGVLRQAARNVREGGGIASMAHEGVSSIVESLSGMQKLVQDVAGGADPSSAQAAFNDFASSIKGVLTSTDYNGIKLLDGGKWSGDERLTPVPGSGGKNSSLSIADGKGTRTLTLTDFSDLASSPILNSDLSSLSAAELTDLSSNLTALTKNMQLYEKSYASLASSMGAEARSIDRQAKILDVTAARSMAGAGRDPASNLLYLLLSDQGKIINNSS